MRLVGKGVLFIPTSISYEFFPKTALAWDHSFKVKPDVRINFGQAYSHRVHIYSG